MSPTGSPDFGAQPAGSPVSPTFDQGEVANRLLMGGGNISRSGRVFWATGFENGLNTDYSIAHPVAATLEPENSTSVAWQGNYALVSRTSNNPLEENRFYKHFLAAQSPGKWGLEAMISMHNLSSSVELRIVDEYPTGSPNNSFMAAIKIVAGGASSDVKVYYRQASGAWALLKDYGAEFAIRLQIFHNVKLVYSFEDRKISRVLIDGTVFEMGVPAHQVAWSTNKRATVDIVHTTQIGMISNACYDNVILTADEP